MKTTLREIKKHKPCESGWEKLCKGLGTTNLDTEVTISQILEINGIRDAFWALRTQEYKDYCLIIADVAESVLHLFENNFPNDNRPRKAIDGIRAYKEGRITLEELEELRKAAAYAATDAAANASDYTAYTANAAAKSAAYATAKATTKAAAKASAYATAKATAYAAAYAAYAATATNAGPQQWEKNEEILRKYLED